MPRPPADEKNTRTTTAAYRSSRGETPTAIAAEVVTPVVVRITTPTRDLDKLLKYYRENI